MLYSSYIIINYYLLTACQLCGHTASYTMHVSGFYLVVDGRSGKLTFYVYVVQRLTRWWILASVHILVFLL